MISSAQHGGAMENSGKAFKFYLQPNFVGQPAKTQVIFIGQTPPANAPLKKTNVHTRAAAFFDWMLARGAMPIRFWRNAMPLVQCSISWCAVARSCSC
jgi:hypothetical protein